MPYLRKFLHPHDQFLLIVQGLACILDGLILVLSLGMIGSNFQIRTCKYRINATLKKLKAKKQNANN